MSASPYRLPLALPRIERAERGRALAGVCAGIARSLDLDATLVRLTFAFLAFAGGAGIVAYAGAWLVLDPESGPRVSSRRRLVGAVALAIAAALALRGLGLPDSLVWPAAFCAAGVVLVRRGGAQVIAGFASVGVGALIFLNGDLNGDGESLVVEPSAVAIALLLVLGPWFWRLAVERDAERTARIRSEERSDMAARVHDSVLQTLALVQREAGDPRRVGALARRQERELRAWLYPAPRTDGASLGQAVEAAAADVEELHGVPVELVRTGDAPLDEQAEAVALAAREAMANAARHSGADQVAVFVDVTDEEIAVFVRDRGTGFNPDAVAAGSHGIAESIRGRLERAGGTAEIASSPDGGTEVELRLRRNP